LSSQVERSLSEFISWPICTLSLIFEYRDNSLYIPYSFAAFVMNIYD
jgi:hypothetical protein